ncbi:MAG: GNAT family N-acetyltransferase [Oscillospiraceae bacterium]|nr:GNAT family N-acetyltransferase [Oscillospiraceae bacterium]
MTTVYLIRHAEAEGNLYRRCHGHYDATITPRGYRQIAELAKRFANVRIDAVYSSDLTRTMTTALAITRPRGIPLHTSRDFREVGVGAWEDRTWAWLARFDLERLVRFNTAIATWQVEGGERMAEVLDRMLSGLRAVIAAHPGETVAVFSHGMALRTLLGTLQGLSLEEIDRSAHAENTAVAKLEADGDSIRVVWRDDASHLPDELTTMKRQAWTKSKDGIEPGVWFVRDPAEGHFTVYYEDERVGAVAVSPIGDGAASVDELCLNERLRGRNLGIRLVGQAVSYARTLGCDTLRAVLPRSDDLALRRAEEYGFAAVSGTAESVMLERRFGTDEAYRIKCFDEAMAENK